MGLSEEFSVRTSPKELTDWSGVVELSPQACAHLKTFLSLGIRMSLGSSSPHVYYQRSARTRAGTRWRRAWREGDRPRRTPSRRPHPRLRAGTMRCAACTVCG